MAEVQLPAEVTQARSKAQSLLGTAGQFQAAEPSVTDVLRQKVQEAYAQNQDIVQPLDKATQEYLTAPQVGREKYQDIFNPFSREKLVSQYVGTQALPMLSLSNIYGNRMGRIEDTLGAGVRGYQAASSSALAKAQLAQQQYESALDEWKTLENVRQEREKMDISRKSAGGDGGGGIESLLEFLGFGKGDEWEIIDVAEETPPVASQQKSGSMLYNEQGLPMILDYTKPKLNFNQTWR